eukprot:TRINITY_DN3458_c0_g1_i1.p1 TRINITY_DN3458_c0_g1~~TRINITY_DN3458_c0_g1_i1.p1  ORF type:complete len:292 (-),score=39.12 TRINITY_DN3458_c0_g1_i1:116-991(-)
MCIRDRYQRRVHGYYVNTCSSYVLKTSEGILDDVDVQKTFEKNLYEKSKKLTSTKALKASDTEIFTYNNFVVIFKVLNDVSVFVLGEFDENEAFLSQVITTLVDALGNITKNQINKRSILENYEHLVILVDEMLDEGLVVNLDPLVIVARATMKDTDSVAAQPAESGFSLVNKIFAKKQLQPLLLIVYRHSPLPKKNWPNPLIFKRTNHSRAREKQKIKRQKEGIALFQLSLLVYFVVMSDFVPCIRCLYRPPTKGNLRNERVDKCFPSFYGACVDQSTLFSLPNTVGRRC